MDVNILTKLGINILLMFSLTALVLAGKKTGLIDFVTRPLDRVANSKVIMVCWFLLTTILSAFTLDTTLAMIIIPIAVIYAESRNLSKLEMLISVTWGNMVGSEWTYFGGGDTIVSWTLLTEYLNRPLDMFIWAKLFWAPTLLACVITLLWLWFKVLSPTYVKPICQRKLNITFVTSVVWLLIFVGVATIFNSKLQYYTIAISVVCSFLSLRLKDLKNLPVKAVYIWTISVFLGLQINNYVASHYTFIMPNYIYTLIGIASIFIIISIIHLGITDSGMALIFLPIVMASQFTDKLWLYVLFTKATSLSYLTILSNGGLAVSASYGMSQKEMFKKGIPIVALQIALFVIYFYIMRGKIIL